MPSLSLNERRRRARGLNARQIASWTRRNFMGLGNRASLTTSSLGTNANLHFFARTPGTGGNSIRVRTVNPATASAALSVVVATSDITVNLATNAGSVPISTADQVAQAMRANAAASALVHVNRAPSNDGSGVVAAMAYTNLAGGVA